MTSPLSTPPVATPPPSTPASFHTAKQSSPRATIEPSPKPTRTKIHSPPSQSVLVLPIPFELCQHVHIFFEESLYNHAIQLLKQLLISGKSTKNRLAYFVPPPSHLDLISTFLIHPRHTTRAPSRARHDASVHALDYLRSLLTTVGAIEAGFGLAFRFQTGRSLDSRRGESGIKRKAGVALEENQPEGHEDENEINHPIAKEGVWATARDFWHVVGWAMNCSIKHRKRWDYWQVWLEFVVSAMEADVAERIILKDEGEKNKPLHASILGRFLLLSEPGDGRQVWKRAIAAIFADGMEASMKQFPEVWKDETKERKKTEDKMELKKAPKVNIEEDVYGDYFGQNEGPDEWSDVATDEDNIDVNNRPSANSVQELTDWFRLGGPRSRALRLRLIALIILVCRETPGSGFLSLFDLFDLLTTTITALPFDQFTAVLHIQALDLLTTESLSSLTQMIINRLIDHNSPNNPDPSDAFDQDILSACFLPFAANTSSAEDNAKLSWAIESLFRLFFINQYDAEPTPILAAAVEAGIVARERRARADRRMRAGTKKAREEEGLRERMGESAERMRMMLGLLGNRQEKLEAARERRKFAKKEGKKRIKERKKTEFAGAKGQENNNYADGDSAAALEEFWEDEA